MGSEYELKYRADGEVLTSVRTTFPARWQKIPMETTYYDTPGNDLAKLFWTLRHRREGDKHICTLKTPGENNLRGEWEVECADIDSAIEALIRSGAPETLKDLVSGGLEKV